MANRRSFAVTLGLVLLLLLALARWKWTPGRETVVQRVAGREFSSQPNEGAGAQTRFGRIQKRYPNNPQIRSYNGELEDSIQGGDDAKLKRLLAQINDRIPDSWRDTFILRDAYNGMIGCTALKMAETLQLNAIQESIHGVGELSGNPDTEKGLNVENQERRRLSQESLETVRSALAQRLFHKYPEFSVADWIEILSIDYAGRPVPIGPYNLIPPEKVAVHFGF